MTDPIHSNLHAKLALLRNDFGAIAKGGVNRGVGDGYKFVEATAVGRLFVEKASKLGLTMVPVSQDIVDIRPTSSGKMTTFTIRGVWRITDVDTGEYIEVVSFGQGADNADKALPKAQTNCMKYAILMLLQAAGDDPEADGNTDRIETPATAARAATAARRAATTVTSEPDPVPADDGARASQTQRVAIRQKARGLGFTDPSLKAFAIEVIGKDSSLNWTPADAAKLDDELDNSVRVTAFLDGAVPVTA